MQNVQLSFIFVALSQSLLTFGMSLRNNCVRPLPRGSAISINTFGLALHRPIVLIVLPVVVIVVEYITCHYDVS